ncbi:RluA family pseudouridine synthase [Segetibacter sp. 3557_3]|uniref:RluA family pseudouridine synthase n=1 Tax=Segetibacter sp. 3557_3 TaxID=2547429 RepID=UPI001058924B|nr:RluA family pseudouridine synthase [Segetibacter sp. 3557_3]TDH25533.1 RluA family pseudouridine synthase [Segetibacter sp. 3557_3]
MKPEILFENDSIIAVNKPSGLLSIPNRMGQEVSLKTLLQDSLGKVFTVHRLDKDTSGVIVFAKTEESHKHLSKIFEGRDVEKYYTGVVNGTLMNKEGSIDASIMEHPGKQTKMIIHKKGKPSLTDYKVIEEFGGYSFVDFRIHTGRTHQIRVHMQYLGNPIVCDELYGDGKPILLSSIKRKFKLSKNEFEERPIMNRLALHSRLLKFNDEHGIPLEIEAPLAKDLKALLQQLRKHSHSANTSV